MNTYALTKLSLGAAGLVTGVVLAETMGASAATTTPHRARRPPAARAP